MRPQRCISSLSFLPHLPSSICILYFLFCILYFVLCISYFAFSYLLRLFFCFTGFLNQRAEEEQVCSAAYIAVIICLLVTFCRTAHCMFLLNDVGLYDIQCILWLYCSSRAIDSVLKSSMFSLPSCIVGSYRAVQPVSSH